VLFSEDDVKVIVGGKLKDAKVWSEEDEDNLVLPSPIKVFNIFTGDLLLRLEGHSEEVLCLKRVSFQHENYLLSAGQDGIIIKWKLSADDSQLLDKRMIKDGTTHMVISLSVPKTNNPKIFAAATDDGIKVYDFETEQVLLKKKKKQYKSKTENIFLSFILKVAAFVSEIVRLSV
jgi:WD40 repeat protein